jgi:ABC-type phosphate transport system substrate-binding protein
VRRRHSRLVGGLAAAAVTLTMLGACSEPSEDASETISQGQAEDFENDRAQAEEIRAAYASLPDRPVGVVHVDGTTTGSLTSLEVDLYRSVRDAADVRVSNNGEDQAFQELCAGQIDLVDSARPISRAEWEACQAVGLDVVQFQVAAEALVLAIKSETDVGADCLTVDQVRDIFRAGSPLTNWSQAPLGFDDVPLKVGGPNLENSGFGFFGRYVLGAPEPSRVDLRSDYYLADTEEAARRFVVGPRAVAIRASRYDDASRRRAQANQAVQDAREELLAAKDEVEIAFEEREKGIRDKRSKVDKQKDQARVVAALERRKVAREHLAEVVETYGNINEVYRGIAAAHELYRAYTGHVAYFRFSTYNLFEDQLRPFEITRSEGQVNCLFPSQRTITSGEYPLARQLLITTTTRSLARAEVRHFLTHFLLNAERSARDARLVPLPVDTIELQQAWLTGDSEPILVLPDDNATEPANPVQSEKPAR